MFQVSQFKTRLSLVFFWLGCGEPPAQNGPWSGGSVLFATSKQSSPSYNFINFLHLLAGGITVMSTNLISWHVCFVNLAWNPQNWGLEEFFYYFSWISMNSWRSWIPCTVDFSCFLLGDAAKNWSDDAAGGLNCASGCGAVKPRGAVTARHKMLFEHQPCSESAKDRSLHDYCEFYSFILI